MAPPITVTAMSDEALDQVAARLPETYSMEIDAADVANLMFVLHLVFRSGVISPGDEDVEDWVRSFASSIARNVGVRYI